MNELHYPWLEAAILIPLVGAFLCGRFRHRAAAISISTTAVTFLTTLGALEDLHSLRQFAAHDHWYFARNWLGDQVLLVDELSVPLLCLASLAYLVTLITTSRAKSLRFSY